MPVNVIAVVNEPLHKTWLEGWATFGDGLTVIVNVFGVPGQLR